MSRLVSLLQEMRGHCSVAVYVGKVSMLKLADFLRGYDFALYKTGIDDSSFLADFRDWIQERFGTTQESWEQLIVSHSANDVTAVDEFWLLLDEILLKHAEHRLDVPLSTPMSTSPAVSSVTELARKPA